MPENDKPMNGENAEKPTTETTSAAEDKNPKSGEVKTYAEDYVKELREENKARRKALDALQKELDEIKDNQKKSSEKKLEDDKNWETLAKQRELDLKDLQAKHATERMQLLRSSIAARYASRLPQAEGDTDPVAEFAKRLQGSTEEEIKADAESLIALLRPSQPEPQQPAAETQPTGQQARRQTTAVAPDGQPTGETDEQKRDRLYGRKPISDPPVFRKQQS